MAILVVVCGKTNVVKCVVKLKNCQIGTKIGVVVDMDLMIMIVVTKRQAKCGKICGKMCGKIDFFWIGTKIGVVVGIVKVKGLLIYSRYGRLQYTATRGHLHDCQLVKE